MLLRTGCQRAPITLYSLCLLKHEVTPSLPQFLNLGSLLAPKGDVILARKTTPILFPYGQIDIWIQYTQPSYWMTVSHLLNTWIASWPLRHFQILPEGSCWEPLHLTKTPHNLQNILYLTIPLDHCSMIILFLISEMFILPFFLTCWISIHPS